MNDLKPVYQDIEDSPYKVKYKNFEFYFSSAFYQRNFEKRYRSYIYEETLKLKNRYKIINTVFEKVIEEVLLISLYKIIEKRGFKIFLNDERYEEI